MSAGKGDTPRPVDGEKFRKNYDLIFLSKLKPRLIPAADSTHEDKQLKTASDPVVENG